MKFKIFSLFLLFSFFIGFSQEKEFDNIKQLVRTYKKRDSTRVRLLNQITKFYTTRDVSKNESVLNEAIKICEEMNYEQGLADSFSNLASFYVQTGNFDKALELAIKARVLQEKLDDVQGLIYTNSNISRIYTHLGQPNKAIKIQLENLELLKKQPNKNKEAQVHFYLAAAYEEIKSYDDVEYHLKAAKKIAKSVGFETGIAIANSSLGTLDNKRKKYTSAINYINKSLIFFKKNNQQANIAHSKLELAVAYANTGRLEEAISNNKFAIEIYKKQNNFKNLKRAYLEQSNYYKRKNDYLNTNKYLEKHFRLKDSIFSKERVAIIEELQAKYETDKALKEKELAEQETAISKLESQKNKGLFIGSLIVAGLILLISLFYYSRLKAKKEAELIAVELKETQKRLALEKQYRDSELKALKAQMNPHFIFNALNSIQGYIVLNKKNIASDYLGKFADLIRNYLHYSDTGFISIPDEVHNLSLYLELEKLRFEEQLEYSFTVDGKANSELINIPTMLIQPYVENAIKHGLLHKKKNRILEVIISKTLDNSIKCIIQDNGIGREKSKEINKNREGLHKSFALNATIERLNLLNYDLERKIGVEIIDLYQNDRALGTKVVLKIPIIKKIK